jgi:hypothetical protein
MPRLPREDYQNHPSTVAHWPRHQASSRAKNAHRDIATTAPTVSAGHEVASSSVARNWFFSVVNSTGLETPHAPSGGNLHCNTSNEIESLKASLTSIELRPSHLRATAGNGCTWCQKAKGPIEDGIATYTFVRGTRELVAGVAPYTVESYIEK